MESEEAEETHIVLEFSKWLNKVMKGHICPLPFPVMQLWFRLNDPCPQNADMSAHFNNYQQHQRNMNTEQYNSLSQNALLQLHSNYFWFVMRTAYHMNQKCTSQLFLATLLQEHSGLSVSGRQTSYLQGNSVAKSTFYHIKKRYFEQCKKRIEGELVAATAVTYWYDNLVKRWKRNLKINANERVNNEGGSSRPYPVRTSTAIGANIKRGNLRGKMPLVEGRPYLDRRVFMEEDVIEDARQLMGMLTKEFSFWSSDVATGRFIPRLVFEQSEESSTEASRVSLNNFLPLQIAPFRPDDLYGNLQTIKEILNFQKIRNERRGNFSYLLSPLHNVSF